MVCAPSSFSDFFQEKWPVAGMYYVGVITTIDVVALPPVSRFNAPKHERLYLTKQRISRYIWIWVHKGDYIFFFITLHDAPPSTFKLTPLGQATLVTLISSTITVLGRLLFS
jgi:hypothetical protein